MKQIVTNQTVKIPEGLTVTVKSRLVTVKGPRGVLKRSFKHLALDIRLLIDFRHKYEYLGIPANSLQSTNDEVKDYLQSKNLLNIDRSRIFNCDESFLLQKNLTDLLEQSAVHGSAFASLVAGGHLGVTTAAAAEGTTEGATATEGETTAATGRSAVTVTGGHRRLRQGEPCQTDNHILSLGRKLVAISKCLMSRDNNHVTIDSSNDRGSWSQKESLRHQEEKYAVRHHCIIRAMKLPCVRIDVIIDPLRLACINVRLRVVA
ncbi:60S ribosomal protein L9 [Cyphomyrmex costatus]|uniref:60S ribosomal protein L9 n=1 Tax=Cyphomyrmex costatus TaxID=456900 RepID=A0A151ILU7_9HYME|nr:60S ribosomal protein L9 [Cyphomyrmex costatus]